MESNDYLASARLVFELLDGGPVTYFSKGKPRLWGGTTRTPHGLARVMERLEGRDVYININICEPRGLRPSRGDVREWRHVLVDLDVCGSDEAGAGTVDPIAWLGKLPSLKCICSTGRGFQAWLGVTTQVLDSEAQRSAIERGTSRWLNSLGAPTGWRVDTSCSDLPRLARLPGTLNTKSGTRASLCYVCPMKDRDAGAAIALGATILSLSGNAPEHPSPNLELSDERDPWKILPFLTQRAQLVFIEGAAVGERHVGLYCLKRSLMALGVDPELLLAMVERANRRSTDPLSDYEVQRIVRQR